MTDKGTYVPPSSLGDVDVGSGDGSSEEEVNTSETLDVETDNELEATEETKEEEAVDESESQPKEDDDEQIDDESEEDETEAETSEKQIPAPKALKYRANEKDMEYLLEPGDVLTEKTEAFVRQLLAKQGLEVKTQQAVEAARHYERQCEMERTKARLAEERYEVEAKPYESILKFLQKNPDAVRQVEQVWGEHLRQHGWTQPIQYDADKVRMERENRTLKESQWAIDVNGMKSGIANELCTKYQYGQDEIMAIDELMREQGMGVVIPGIPLDVQGQVVRRQAEMAREMLIARGKLRNPDVAKAAAEKAAVDQKLQRMKKIQSVKNPTAGSSAAVSSKGSGKKTVDWEKIPPDQELKIMVQRAREAEKRK